jgi:hypothetical protein
MLKNGTPTINRRRFKREKQIMVQQNNERNRKVAINSNGINGTYQLNTTPDLLDIAITKKHHNANGLLQRTRMTP